MKHGDDLYAANPMYEGLNLCPYCKELEGDRNFRVCAHIIGFTDEYPPLCKKLFDRIDEYNAWKDSGEIGEEPDHPVVSVDGYHISTIHCNDYKRIFIELDDYLDSTGWAEKRKRILERDGFKCRLCGSAKNLRVHHITYENVPFENDDDLLTVCDKCHKDLHSTDIARKTNG